MNKLHFPLSSFRYKEMLELVISPSFTVNSAYPGKLKLNRAGTDVWTLSDIEGRPPGVRFAGPVVVPASFGKYCHYNNVSSCRLDCCLWTKTLAYAADNFV